MLRGEYRKNLEGAQRGQLLAALEDRRASWRGCCCWTSKNAEKEKVEGKAMQIFVFKDCGQCTVIAVGISWAFSPYQALVQAVGIYEVI